MGLFMEPNEVWRVTVTLLINSHALPDMKLKFTAPSSATFQWLPMDSSFPTAPNTLATEIVIAGAGATELHILVGIAVNSTTAGNLQLQFAQNASNGSASTIEANSNIVAHLVNDPDDTLITG